MMVAIRCIRASGALDFVISLFAPLVSWMEGSGEVLPLGILRPF